MSSIQWPLSVSPEPVFSRHASLQARRVTRLLYLASATIGLLSVYDAWLVYVFREVIDEENHFCRWLISLEPEYVSVFLVSKLLGTATVVSILVLLTRHWQRIAVPTVLAVLLFQFGLMGYLHVYDSRRPIPPQVAQAAPGDPVDRWLARQGALDAADATGRIAERKPKSSSRRVALGPRRLPPWMIVAAKTNRRSPQFRKWARQYRTSMGPGRPLE